MFLQAENSAIHQIEGILWVDLGKEITVLQKTYGSSTNVNTPRCQKLVDWAYCCMTHRNVKH